MVDLHRRGGDILGGRTVAGAVIGSEEVIVDRLGDTHYAAFVAVFEHEFADFVAGVHRIVAAVVEEIADIVLSENLENTAVIGIVDIGILQLVAAGTEGRGRRIF